MLAVVDGLGVPWHFAGIGMIVLGLVVILDMHAARRGVGSSPQQASNLPLSRYLVPAAAIPTRLIRVLQSHCVRLA